MPIHGALDVPEREQKQCGALWSRSYELFLVNLMYVRDICMAAQHMHPGIRMHRSATLIDL